MALQYLQKLMDRGIVISRCHNKKRIDLMASKSTLFFFGSVLTAHMSGETYVGQTGLQKENVHHHGVIHDEK
jgi:hypothetical protein